MEIKENGDVYCDSQKEYNKIIKEIKEKDIYEIKPLSNMNNKDTGRGVFCSIKKEYRFGKCGFCNSIISVYGIYGHGRKCEKCGKTIYLEYVKGDLISFAFWGDKTIMTNVITLKLAETPNEDDKMIFEMEIPEYQYHLAKIDEVLKKLEQFKDCYTIEKINDKDCYVFFKPTTRHLEESEYDKIKINIYNSQSDGKDRYKAGYQNCSVVKIWDEKEYSEHSGYKHCLLDNTFPIPESFHIFKDWKIEKTIHEICHRSGVNSSQSYYSGRGVGDITADNLIRMFNLIKKFKGEEASKNFVSMVKDIQTLTAIIFLKHLLILDKNNYRYESTNTEKVEESNIAVDGVGSAYGTFLSMVNIPEMRLYGKLLGVDDMFENAIDGLKTKHEDYQTNCIKQKFLNSI